MSQEFEKKLKELQKKRSRKRFFMGTGCALGGITAVYTACILMQPAITLGQNPQCGLEEHTH